MVLKFSYIEADSIMNLNDPSSKSHKSEYPLVKTLDRP